MGKNTLKSLGSNNNEYRKTDNKPEAHITNDCIVSFNDFLSSKYANFVSKDLIKVFNKIKKENNFREYIDIEVGLYINGEPKYIDGKTIMFDPSEEEIFYAYLFKNKYGCTVTMRPRTRNISGVRISDYYINSKIVDLKGIKGKNKRTISRSIKDAKIQADNFIIRLNEGSRTIREAINDINILKKHNDWINEIMLFDKNNSFIKKWK